MAKLSPAREAFTLPVLLLTVVLLGSLRVDAQGQLSFIAPTLLSLVLAVAVIALLSQAGLVAPEALVSSARGALANLNGLVVLLTLFLASAQVFTMLTPEEGLLEILFNGFFLALLWTMAVARPDGPRLLRSLLVLCGWAFVLRFVVLNGLAAPDGSFVRRIFATALEGLALGGLGLRYHPPATGYIAFTMLAFYFVGLRLMPAAPWTVADMGSRAGDGSKWVQLPPAPAMVRTNPSDRTLASRVTTAEEPPDD